MDQGHHISTQSMSSFFMTQPSVIPQPFPSSSISSPSPYSSFFGSSSPAAKSQTISFTSSAASPFASSASSFSSSGSSASSFSSSVQSPFSNASFSSASSSISSASPQLSPFAHSANSSLSSGFNSSFSTISSSPSTSRMKYWKNRDYLKETPANQLKNRRDEFVARFRGLDLCDDELVSEDPGANDPAWSWDNLCNTQWDTVESEPKKSVPWYVFDDSLTWDEFLELSERDRIASGKPPADIPAQFRFETMRDLDEVETIDEKETEADPWSVKTEIIIEPLINIQDPNIMLCFYCKQYALQKNEKSKLTCHNCESYHQVKPSTTIYMLKQRMLHFLNEHRLNCSHNFSSYTISKGDIVLICDSCDKLYNITENL